MSLPIRQTRSDDPMVAALLRERDGYVARGLDERVAQVDEQLRLRGQTPPAARAVPPKGRTTAGGTQTATPAP